MAIGKLNIAYFIAIVGAVSLPTVTAVTYHEVTKDPRLKPLAITKENLDAFNGDPDDMPPITVVINWDQRDTRDTEKRQLSALIIKAFRAKGVDATIMIRPAAQTSVTYHVGASVLGPYPRSYAAAGIRPAAEAAHMLEKDEDS